MVVSKRWALLAVLDDMMHGEHSSLHTTHAGCNTSLSMPIAHAKGSSDNIICRVMDDERNSRVLSSRNQDMAHADFPALPCKLMHGLKAFCVTEQTCMQPVDGYNLAMQLRY